MALRVSTTGFDVSLDDLGIVLVHPTVDEDLILYFTSDELRDSQDLTNAVQNGDLVADDGQFEINATDYDPSEVLNQELQLKLDRRFISHDELSAGYLDTPIETGVFPLALNSTASTTRNIYTPAGRWGTWQIDADDKVVITGSTAADGTYTVESISDHQNFIVVESIPDSTGGNITVYHPNAANRIGVDDSPFSTISGQNLQEILDDVDHVLTTGGFSDQLVKVTDNDTTAGYLYTKLVAGTGISLTEQNDGNNETLEITTDNGVGHGAGNIGLIFVDSNNKPYIDIISQSWFVYGRFVFMGTDEVGTPSNIEMIAWAQSDKNLEFRIFDLTNNQLITTVKTVSNTEPLCQDFGSLLNLPTNKAIFEIQGRKGTGIGYLSYLQIIF